MRENRQIWFGDTERRNNDEIVEKIGEIRVGRNGEKAIVRGRSGCKSLGNQRGHAEWTKIRLEVGGVEGKNTNS